MTFAVLYPSVQWHYVHCSTVLTIHITLTFIKVAGPILRILQFFASFCVILVFKNHDLILVLEAKKVKLSEV